MQIFDSIWGYVLLMLSLSLIFPLMQLANTQNMGAVAGGQLQMVAAASKAYVKKHNATLYAQADTTSGPSITIQNLVDEGFLQPMGTNPWRQSYQIFVRKASATTNSLRIIVITTGGDTSARSFSSTIASAAAKVGAGGAFVPFPVIPGYDPSMLVGAGYGWTITFASLGIASPGAGHLGYVSDYDSSDLAQDYLYRVAVPGNPDLNAMQTELDMSDHGIENIKEAQFVERTITTEACTASTDQGRIFLDREQGLYLCRNGRIEVLADSGNSLLIKQQTVVKNGSLIDKPVCPPKTDLEPQIFVSPSIAEIGPTAPPMSAFQTWPVSLSDTQWQVFMRILTSDKSIGGSTGWGYPGDDYARISVTTICGRPAAVTP